MSKFTGNMKVEFLGLSEEMKIEEPISFYSTKADKGLKTTLLPGFISDGDSTPSFLKPVVRGSKRRFQRGYAFHDAWFRTFKYYYLLNPDMKIPSEHIDGPDSYKTGNLLLDEALEVANSI